ncbi:MAG: SoxR reducing system RseC family protein [Cardiobacteriaceae bacterium]|nr:SoxR reducing system RseC family protein [Cardiobacteriaceae bacterium]
MDNPIRVRVLAADTDTIRIAPMDDVQDCKRCAEGNGCGNRPWFRGFFYSGYMVLPNQGNWRDGDYAELLLSSRGLNLSAFLIYGFPLLMLLLVLFLTRSFSEGWQVFFLFLALLVTPFVSRMLSGCIVVRYVRLQPIANLDGMRCYPESKV